MIPAPPPAGARADLSAVPLFAGLSPAELQAIRGQMRPRRFAPREALCRQGAAGSSLFVITSGLAHVIVEEGGGEILGRLRRGDALGEMSLLTGEPRSATVIAAAPTEALELDRASFLAAIARSPVLLDNLVQILSGRLARSNRRSSQGRGEAVALIVGPGDEALAREAADAARAASPGDLAVLDWRGAPDPASIDRFADALDERRGARSAVLALLPAESPALPHLLEQADRAILVADACGAALVARQLAPGARPPDMALRGEGRPGDVVASMRVLRALDAGGGAGWLGRYLARARVGLALGAGGARGYAHVGALQALEAGGYAIDAVAGSSIGGIVGACLGMGMRSGELEAALRRMFTPESVAALFRLSLGPSSPALDLWIRLLRDLTEDRDFADLRLPLVVMTADLETRQPAPLREGPLWEALLATTALPGLAPPVQRGAQRLVDGLTLIPVPTEAAGQPHADVTVAVNLMSRDVLPAWPGAAAAPAAPRGRSALDTLLEAMELTHADLSTRHAALADVTITPRFGPSLWKDFPLADAFLGAGRAAGEGQLPALRALARPAQSPEESP